MIHKKERILARHALNWYKSHAQNILRFMQATHTYVRMQQLVPHFGKTFPMMMDYTLKIIIPSWWLLSHLTDKFRRFKSNPSQIRQDLWITKHNFFKSFRPFKTPKILRHIKVFIHVFLSTHWIFLSLEPFLKIPSFVVQGWEILKDTGNHPPAICSQEAFSSVSIE